MLIVDISFCGRRREEYENVFVRYEHINAFFFSRGESGMCVHEDF